MSTHERQDGAGTPLHHAETTEHLDPGSDEPEVATGDPEEVREDRHAAGGTADPGGDLHARDTADAIDPSRT